MSSSFVLRVLDEKMNRMTRSDVSLGMNATSEFLLPSAKVPLSGDEIEMDSTIRTGPLLFSRSMRMHSTIPVLVFGTRANVDAGEMRGRPSGCANRS